MRDKLEPKTKTFFMTLFQYFLIVGGITLALSVKWGTEEPRAFDLSGALSIVGFIAIIILGVKIALDFTHEAHPEK